jgi:hypothetical protein
MCSNDQMPEFSGETPYSLMFGPDVCGYSTKKVSRTIVLCASVSCVLKNAGLQCCF